MKIISKVFVVVLALILELVIIDCGGELLFGRSHGMMADTQYRRKERLEAFVDYHHHPSPESKATFQEEMRLMHKHEDWKLELTLGLFVILNGVGIYYYFRHGHRTTTA
jgi:hypothetical protein